MSGPTKESALRHEFREKARDWYIANSDSLAFEETDRARIRSLSVLLGEVSDAARADERAKVEREIAAGLTAWATMAKDVPGPSQFEDALELAAEWVSSGAYRKSETEGGG